MSNWEKGNSAYCFDCCIFLLPWSFLLLQGLMC